jgi:heme/copper-type cytochrome/quinol oxidase subunit 4
MKSSKNKLIWLNKFLKFLLITCLIVPYTIWKFYAQPKIKELEFTGTFRFAIALTLVPLWLIIVGVLLTIYFGFAIGLGFVLFVLLLALLTIKL